jgi:Zn-dependent protease
MPGLGLDFDTVHFIGFMLGFVIGTTFHEFMHAYSALRLGDDTAARMGRITLNPAAHFDPFGFFMGVMLALGVPFALAWGRPVPVTPNALRFGRRGMAIVAVAGPLSNLAFATALSIPYNFGATLITGDVRGVIYNMIFINILLFAFNLIPIPPLDGFNISVGILPNAWVPVLEPIRTYSLPILLGAVFLLPFVGSRFLGIDLNVLGVALRPVVSLLSNVFFSSDLG